MAFSLKRAMRKGYLDILYEPSYKKSIKYLQKQISDDGIVKRSSGGTPIMCSIEKYNKIPCIYRIMDKESRQWRYVKHCNVKCEVSIINM